MAGKVTAGPAEVMAAYRRVYDMCVAVGLVGGGGSPTPGP